MDTYATTLRHGRDKDATTLLLKRAVRKSLPRKRDRQAAIVRAATLPIDELARQGRG